MTEFVSLSGSAAVVTGAGSPSGIGFATASLLARLGAEVVLSGAITGDAVGRIRTRLERAIAEL